MFPKTIDAKTGPTMKYTNGFNEYTSEKPSSIEYKYKLDRNQKTAAIIYLFFLALCYWIACSTAFLRYCALVIFGS